VLLADPNWLKKVREGRSGELRPYSKECMETLF
jgi:hypothetical protein